MEKKQTIQAASFTVASTLGFILSVGAMLGCENAGSAILPEGNLTPEQIEKLRAEDAAVDESESQGKQPKPKSKK